MIPFFALDITRYRSVRNRKKGWTCLSDYVPRGMRLQAERNEKNERKEKPLGCRWMDGDFF